ARRRGLASWGSVVLGGLATPAALLLTLAVAFGVQALLAGVFPAPWVARPLPAMAAFWLVALAVTLWTVSLLTRRAAFAGVWAGVWIVWSLLGLLLGVLLPGLSFLFLVPSLVAGVIGLAGADRPLASILPALVAALVWLPILIFLYDGLGLTGLLATCLLLVFVFATLAPLVAVAGPLGRRWLPLTAAAAAVVCVVLAMMSPPFSPANPRNLNIQLHEDADTGVTRWLARGAAPFPPAFLKAAEFASKPVAPFPWSPPMSRAVIAPAPALKAAAPELVVLEDVAAGGKRHLRLRLTSPRGAPVGTIQIPEGAKLESIVIDGQRFPMEDGRGRRPAVPQVGWQSYTNFTLPSQGSEIEVVLGAAQPTDWYVIDRSYGLPP